MTLQFNIVALLLVILIILGLLSHNSAITISAAVLLIMQQTFLSQYIPWIDQYGLKLGIMVLTLGVLSPLVSGKIPLPELSAFIHWKMFSSIGVGILVAWLAGHKSTRSRHRAYDWYSYRRIFLWWHTRWPTYCCRYISFTFRENLNEKQIPHPCCFKRFLLCRTRRICSSWLKPYIRSQSIIMD